MKLKIPAKTIEVCDVCQRENSSWLTDCTVCVKKYCLLCRAIIAGCVHEVDICKRCGDLDEVREVVDKFVKPLLKVLDERSKALKRIKL